MALTPPEVVELHSSLKSLLEIWLRIKLAYQKAFSKGDITKEQEAAFLQLKSDLSRHFRTISNRLPKELGFDGEDMMDMLKNAISMQHLQGQPTAEKKNLFGRWHKIYIRMSRTFGAVEVINEGYYPSLHRDLLRDPTKKKIVKASSPKKASSGSGGMKKFK